MKQKLFMLLSVVGLSLFANAPAKADSTSGYVCYTTFQNWNGGANNTYMAVGLYSQPFCQGTYLNWVSYKGGTGSFAHTDAQQLQLMQMLQRAGLEGARVQFSHDASKYVYYTYVFSN